MLAYKTINASYDSSTNYANAKARFNIKKQQLYLEEYPIIRHQIQNPKI